MDKRALDFLGKHRIGSLAVLLKKDSPHASTMHYSHSNNPLEIYFMTENTSKKCEALLDGKSQKASFVTGFSEEEWITLQMDGEVSVVIDKRKLEKIHEVHFEKHPEPKKWKDDPATLFLVFKPTWWRYTEYKPNFFVLSSEENESKK